MRRDAPSGRGTGRPGRSETVGTADRRTGIVRPVPALRQTRRQDRKHLAMLVEQKREGRDRQMGLERGMRLQDLRGEIR